MSTLDLVRQPNGGSVRGSEAAGTTVLAATDSKWQVFNLSANRTCLLPQANIKAGDAIRIDLRTTFVLTISTATSVELTRLSSAGSWVVYVALVDAPTAFADWYLVAGSEYISTSFGGSGNLSGNSVYNAGSINIPAGRWLLTTDADSAAFNTGSGAPIQFQVGFGTTATTFIDQRGGSFPNYASGSFSYQGSYVALPDIQITLTSLTTYYHLVNFAQNVGSGETLTWVRFNSGRITAKRY